MLHSSALKGLCHYLSLQHKYKHWTALTNVILPHLLEFVHSQLLLLQAVQHDGAQVGELSEGVGRAPQPLVDHLAQGEQSMGHSRPALPQSDLKQGPHDASSVLWVTVGKTSARGSTLNGAEEQLVGTSLSIITCDQEQVQTCRLDTAVH